MTVQITAGVTLVNNHRGLDKMTLTGDAPAVASVINAVLADSDHLGHPNEVKIDFLRGHQGKGFVRAYCPEELKGVKVSWTQAAVFGEQLLTQLGLEVVEALK